MYCVYVHILKSDRRKYIGLTKYGENPNRRWNNGNGYRDNVYFYNAIQKYGWGNFEHVILFSELTKEQAVVKERACIKLFNTQDRLYGFNLTVGGDGTVGLSPEIRDKINSANTKHHVPAEELRYYYLDLNWTMKECAEYFGCSINTIQRNLAKIEILSRSNKIYIDKDTLIKLLVIEHKTRQETADILGCSLGSIAKYIKKFNIQLKESLKIPSYDEIYYNYITLNHSRIECSNYFGCTESMFKSWLHLYNIKKDHTQAVKNSSRYKGIN